MDEIVTHHSRLTHRIMSFEETRSDPVTFLDRLFKMHLLQLVQRKEKYGVVEEACSQEGVSYTEAIKKINAKTQRLITNFHSETGSLDLQMASKQDYVAGMAARAASDLCLFCGRRGHWAAECPTRQSQQGATIGTDSEHRSSRQRRFDRFKIRKAEAKVDEAQAQFALLKAEAGEEEETVGAAWHHEDALTKVPAATAQGAVAQGEERKGKGTFDFAFDFEDQGYGF